MKTLRLRAVRIFADDIPRLLSGECVAQVLSHIPSDAVVVRYGEEWQTGSAIVVLTHPSFEEINEGDTMPISDATTSETPR